MSEQVLGRIGELAALWGKQPERRTAQALSRADFDALADAGYLHLGLPRSRGGHWQDIRGSIDGMTRAVRQIARVDPSVALVSCMHPVVQAYWWGLDTHEPADLSPSWLEQCDFVSDSSLAGQWWGTLTSEPGSGGDLANTKALATPVGGLQFELTGEKHFGSGSGICRFMMTTGRAEGIEAPLAMFMDMDGAPWEQGDTRIELLRRWDGHGMTATQSHAFRLDHFPATRMADPGVRLAPRALVSTLSGCMFSAVIMGVLDAAMDWAQPRFARAERPFEVVGRVDVQRKAWLARQAFAGMIRSVEVNGSGALNDTQLGKVAIADLVESLFMDMARVLSGSVFSRSQPLGQWAQDIRALGYLRPPWGLAYDQIDDSLSGADSSSAAPF